MNTIRRLSTACQSRKPQKPADLEFRHNRRAVLALLLAMLLPSTVAQAAVPGSVGYQAYLTDPAGTPIDSNIAVTFKLYAGPTGGLAWSETQTVTVAQGLLDVRLGSVNPFPGGLFNEPLWLGVTVGSDAEMLPRRPLRSVAYSLKADDAESLSGAPATVFNQSAHVEDSLNPHENSGWDLGADHISVYNAHAADASAHHVRTSSLGDLVGQASDDQIPGSITRDTEFTWGRLSGIPAGFADGIDNESGDITGVIAGPGLVGGGLSGHTNLGLAAPLEPAGDLLLASGNKLGIGLTAPNRPLYVANRAPGLDYALKLDNPHPGIGSTGVGIQFSTEGDGGGNIVPDRGKGGLAYVSTDTWNRGAFHFLQDPNILSTVPGIDDAVMTIANNGNVGIGTTAPGEKLAVHGAGTDTYVSIDGGFNGDSGFRIDENDLKRWRLLYRVSTGDLVVRDDVGALDTMTFDVSGRVGIGTSAPQAELDVAGDIRVAGNVEVGGLMFRPERTRYYTLPAAAFKTQKDDAVYSVNSTEFHNLDFWSSLTVIAPVHLPQHAQIKKLTAYWIDRSPVNGTAKIIGRSLTNPIFDQFTVASTITVGNEPGIRYWWVTLSPAYTINNFDYQYYVEVEFPADDGELSLRGVRIEYTTTDP